MHSAARGAIVTPHGIHLESPALHRRANTFAVCRSCVVEPQNAKEHRMKSMDDEDEMDSDTMRTRPAALGRRDLMKLGAGVVATALAVQRTSAQRGSAQQPTA